MNLKKSARPGVHQCYAMRCKSRPKWRHQLPDNSLIELCERHHTMALAEYGEDVSQVVVSELGPRCEHPDCFEHYKDTGFSDCLHEKPAVPVQAAAEALPEPEILEPAALAKVEQTSSDLATLTKAEFVAQLQREAAGHAESLESVKAFEVKTQEDFTFLESVLAEAKGAWAEYERRRTSFTKPANSILREFNGWFKPAQSALKEFESVAKGKIARYRLDQLQEQQRLVDAARAAEEPKEIQQTLVAASEAAPEHTTTQIVDKWVYLVEDVERLPGEFMMPDEKKIGAYVRANKDKAKIPGVRIWNATTVRSSSK